MKQNLMKKLMAGVCLFSLMSTTSWATQQDVKAALTAGHLKEALAAYQQLDKVQSSNIEGKLLWARILLAQDKTEDAFDFMESLTEAHSDNVQLQYRFGQSAMVMAQKASIFSKLGYAKDGVKAWNKALELDPKHKGALKGLISFHRFAPGMAGGDIDKALAYAKTLQTIDGPAGALSLVRVYHSMEEKGLAAQTLDSAIVKYPTDSHLLFQRGVMFLDEKKWQTSYEDLTSALSNADKDSDKANILYQLGKLAVKSGSNTEAAIQSVKTLMAMEEHRYPQWGNLRLAQLYVKQGDIPLAATTLKLVDDDDDDDLEDEVKKLKKQLKKLAKRS